MRLLPKAILIFLGACWMAACGPAASLPTPIPGVTSTAPPVIPSLPPADFSWLRLAPPSGWSETPPGHYQGAGGYAWLELRDDSGARLETACMLEANGDKPARYGAYPEIRDIKLDGRPACLILPSPDQPAARRQEALYLLPAPDSARPNALLALHADSAHILDFIQGITFAQPLPTPPPAACDFSLTGQPPITTQQAGLRIDEFPIAQGENCSPERLPQDFDQRVQSGAAAARAGALRDQQYQSARLERLNARLAPFGFQVQTYGQQLFRVLRGGQVLRSNLSWLGQVSVRSDGQDFLFPVVDSYNGNTYLVSADGLHTNDSPDLLAFDLVFPVYAGSDRISLAYDTQRIARPAGSPALLQIQKNGQLIQTFSVSGANPASGPVRGLWAWQGHWYLDLPGLVLEDGAPLNERLGYPEIFSWRLVKEKPFYFYRQAGQVHVVYDGQTLPNPYDDVLAEPQWTEAILIQMRTYESGLVFYARRGSTWYYVVLAAD